MSEVPQLRPARAGDVTGIARFQTACWREAYADLVPAAYLERVGIVEREVRWRERIVTGTRHVVLAESGGSVVGVVSWGTTPLAGVPELELMSLYVAAEHRGSGLAARLLHRALGAEPAHLWVFDANPRAHTFYRKHRFAATDRHEVDPDTGLGESLFVRR